MVRWIPADPPLCRGGRRRSIRSSSASIRSLPLTAGQLVIDMHVPLNIDRGSEDDSR
jgi:hypothetical protein